MAINFTRNIGMTVLAIWLIFAGVSGLVAFVLPSPIMAVLALVAGILILVVPRLLNYIVAIYLIVIGLLGLFGGHLH